MKNKELKKMLASVIANQVILYKKLDEIQNNRSTKLGDTGNIYLQKLTKESENLTEQILETYIK